VAYRPEGGNHVLKPMQNRQAIIESTTVAFIVKPVSYAVLAGLAGPYEKNLPGRCESDRGVFSESFSLV